MHQTSPTIIIGLGPTGLALAIEACKKDSKRRKVIAITDRPDYTRHAIFRLDADIFPYLEELVGSEKIAEYFQRKWIGPLESLNGWDFHTIQMKTFEKLLYETLCQQENVEIICLPKHSPNRITAIDKEAHTLTITEQKDSVSTEKTLQFKYLIAADGPSHQIANFFAAENIQYHDTHDEQIYHKHARVTYKLPDNICAEKFRTFLQPVNSSKQDISSLKELNWALQSDPEVRVFVIDGYLFIAAECPINLCNEDCEAIDQWIRAVLALICPQSAVDELIKMDAATFEVCLEEANRTLIPLVAADDKMDNELLHENSAYFFQMGDALRKTHYQTGSGAVVGLREAKVFGKFLASPQSLDDLKEYHANVAAIRADNRLRVNTFIDNRRKREREQSNSGQTQELPMPSAAVLAKSMSDVIGVQSSSVPREKFVPVKRHRYN